MTANRAKDLGRKLKELRLRKGMSQEEVSKVLGIKRATISNYEQGRTSPDLDGLTAFAKYFGVTTDYLIYNDLQPISKEKTFKVPVLGRIPAGIPVSAIETIIGWEDLPIEMKTSGDFFALEVSGESMTPQIKDGDHVILRQQSYADNGDIVAVRINGYDATLKRIKKVQGGLLLIPNNPNFETKFYTAEQVEGLPVEIIGKAIELRRGL